MAAALLYFLCEGMQSYVSFLCGRIHYCNDTKEIKGAEHKSCLRSVHCSLLVGMQIDMSVVLHSERDREKTVQKRGEMFAV